MKRVKLLFIAAASSLVMFSCNNDDAKENDGTDSLSTSQSDKVDDDDAEFLKDAWYGGLKEVEKGKLAQSKGMSADIKELGSMMVTDHSAMGEKIKALAAKKNIELKELSTEDAEDIRNNDKKGNDFDKDYAADMVEDHEKDIKKFEEAASDAKDADIKALANEALPTLRHHLEKSKAAKDKVKG